MEAEDEFAYLAQDASAVGATGPLPKVRRVTIETTGDDRLGALVWGSTAPEFAFVHGAGMHAHSWDRVILRLGRPAVAIELPGHGESVWRDSFDYTPPAMAESVQLAIRALASGPLTYVGHSLGASTGIVVAARNPDLVTRLVLVDAMPRRLDDVDRPSGVRDFIDGPRTFPSREAVVERALAHGFGRDRAALERGVRMNTRVLPDGSVAFKHHLASPPDGHRYEAFESSALWPLAESIGAPTLLVRGTRGILSERHGDEFLRRFRDPRGVVVLESGHNVPRDDPAGLADVIAAFSADDELTPGSSGTRQG